MNSNRGSVAFPIAGLLLILLLSYGMPAVCDARTNSMRYGPFFQKSVQNRQVKYETSSVKLVWVGLMNVYARVISPADGPRSPSYPTGSAYGKQAIRTYGFFLGVLLTADRLLHEADKPQGPIIKIYGKQRFYDPLEHNTYWWHISEKINRKNR